MLELMSSIVQVISWGYVVVQLRNKKINIKSIKNILLMLTMILCIFILLKLNVGFAKTIIAYSMFTICYKYIYNISIEESAIINFISILMHCMAEIVFVIIISIVTINIDTTIINEYLYLTPLSGLLIFLMIIILFGILRKTILKIQSLFIRGKDNNIFLILLIISFAIMFSINISNWKDKNMVSNIMTVIVFGFVLIFLFYEKLKVINANNKFDKLFSQSQNVSSLLEKHKKINHENKNDLRIIREKAKAIGNNDIKEYVDEILKDKKMSEDNKWIAELTKIKDAGISGFISLKINEMIDNGMKVIVSISNKLKEYDFEKLTKKEYKNLCRIFGVYLDNAYEASKESEEKEVTLEMNVNEENIEIIISNTFIGTVDTEKMDNYGYSTKGNSHGTGLSLVKDIIMKSEYLTQKRKVINNFFFQYLYIEKNKKM